MYFCFRKLGFMSKNDTLFRLIKSLNQAEKRYLSIYFNTNNKEFDRNYLILFEAYSKLTASDTYDESIIQNALEGLVEAKKISALKHYLYQSILRGLRNYHANTNNPRIQLSMLQTDILLLYEKGLLKEALKLINKAKGIALKHDYNFIFLDVIRLERRISRQYSRKKNLETKDILQEVSHQKLLQINQELSILDLYEEIFLVMRTQSVTEAVLEDLGAKIAAQLTPVDLSQDVSFEIIMYHQLSYAMYYQMLGEWGKVAIHYKYLLDHFEKERHLLNDSMYQERYLSCLNNYINFCYVNKEEQELHKQIKNLGKLKFKSQKLQIQVEQYFYYSSMIYAFIRKAFGEVMEIAPKIDKLLSKYELNINIKRRITFLINIAIACLLEGRYDESQTRVSQIINEPKFEIRTDIQMRARIFRIILFYEQQNYDTAEFEYFTAIRYLKKYRKNNTVEKNILANLKKIIQTNNKSALIKLFDYLKDKSDYEDIFWWVERHI